MRVNVDSKMLADPRFKKLGHRLRLSHFEVFGRCLPVWTMAYENRRAELAADDVDALAELAGFADAMIAADLADDLHDGTVRLRGVEQRVQWLLGQDAKRELAANARRGKSLLKPRQASPGKSPVHIPRDVPDQEQEHDQDSGSGSGSVPELPDLGATVRAERRSSDCVTTNDARRRELWGRAWNYAATKHHELKSRGIDPTARNCWSGTPQGIDAKALNAIIADLTQGDAPDFEQAWDTIRNRIDVQAESAKAAEPPTLRWFTPAWMWKAENFAIASAMSPEQAAQRRSARAGPSSAGATEPPRRIKDL